MYTAYSLLIGCKVAADIAFLVDSSGSIRDKNPSDGSYDNWQLLLDFIANIVDHLYIGTEFSDTRVGLIRFSDTAELEFTLDRYTTKNELINRIKSLKYAGSFTNTQAALNLLHTRLFGTAGDRLNVPNIAIVITDGESNIRRENTIPEAETARAKGAYVFSIGITNSINRDELRQMSSFPHQEKLNWFTSLDFKRLDDILSLVVASVCPSPPPVVGKY